MNGDPQVRVFISITWYKEEPAWKHALEGTHFKLFVRYIIMAMKRDKKYNKFAIVATVQGQLWLYLTKSVKKHIEGSLHRWILYSSIYSLNHFATNYQVENLFGPFSWTWKKMKPINSLLLLLFFAGSIQCWKLDKQFEGEEFIEDITVENLRSNKYIIFFIKGKTHKRWHKIVW